MVEAQRRLHWVERISRGSGLTNMRDRVGAVGGELTVASRPGAGTRVSGVLHFAREAAASPG